jgi:CDP-diglyceride synthetase
MGRLRGSGLAFALAPAAARALLLVHDPRPASAGGGGPRPPSDLDLVGVEALCAALLAVTADLVARLARRGGPLAVVGVATAVLYLGLGAWLFGSGAGGVGQEGRRALALYLALPALWAMLDAAGRDADRRRFTRAGASALWIVTPLSALSYVWLWHGTSGLCALLALSKVGDIAGYYFGSLIGRSHPFPRISPGKTTAGCVASLLAATALGGVLSASGALPPGPLGIGGGLLFGCVVNVAAQAGDLLESACKRSAGVKDAGTWFGPSGGMLDLVDSLLLSVPAGLLAWPLLFG